MNVGACIRPRETKSGRVEAVARRLRRVMAIFVGIARFVAFATRFVARALARNADALLHAALHASPYVLPSQPQTGTRKMEQAFGRRTQTPVVLATPQACSIEKKQYSPAGHVSPCRPPHACAEPSATGSPPSGFGISPPSGHSVGSRVTPPQAAVAKSNSAVHVRRVRAGKLCSVIALRLASAHAAAGPVGRIRAACLCLCFTRLLVSSSACDR
jgi:hypothetical protein